jgi:uncharacterized membrane protein
MMYHVLQIQVLATFLVNYYAANLFTALQLPLEQVPVFRTAVWGTGFYALFSICQSVLLDFGFPRLVRRLGLWFFLSHGLAASAMSAGGNRLAAYGFALAALSSCALSVFALWRTVNRFTALIFTARLNAWPAAGSRPGTGLTGEDGGLG